MSPDLGPDLGPDITRRIAQADNLLLLASLFRQPGPETLQRLELAGGATGPVSAAAPDHPRFWHRHLATLVSQMRHLGCERILASHNWLFDGPVYCPINETAFVRRDKGAILADLSGFYRAFGFELGPASGEKGDHLGTELEFLAMLMVMQSNAERNGLEQEAETCRDALRSFASDHLGEWLPSFCDQLQETADLAFHDSAAELLREAWAEVCRAQGLDVSEARHTPVTDRGTPYECGQCAAACLPPDFQRGTP